MISSIRIGEDLLGWFFGLDERRQPWASGRSLAVALYGEYFATAGLSPFVALARFFT
ncbi:MAG TPA: hypothetical protein VGL40_01285 [Bacillota bacterium]